MPPLHFTDETLELYLLDLADETLKRKIEEHLIACIICVTRIEQVEKEIAVMRMSLEKSTLDSRIKALMVRLHAGEIPLYKPFVN
jgi:hypothetical protein